MFYSYDFVAHILACKLACFYHSNAIADVSWHFGSIEKIKTFEKASALRLWQCRHCHSSDYSTSLIGWGKGRNVTSAGWQVTLCDPTWHVSSCSGAVLAAQPAIRFLTLPECVWRRRSRHEWSAGRSTFRRNSTHLTPERRNFSKKRSTWATYAAGSCGRCDSGVSCSDRARRITQWSVTYSGNVTKGRLGRCYRDRRLVLNIL